MIKNIELDNFIIKFQFVDNYLCSEEPDKYFTFIKGKLFYTNHNFDDSKPICVGIIEFYLLRLNEITDDDANLFFTLDSIDDNIIQYYDALFEDDDIKDEILDTFEQGLGGNILIIDKVRIHRKFRGRNLGLILAQRCMKIFADCAYFALRPFPMQYSSSHKDKSATDLKKLHLDGFAKDEKKSFKRLISHWEKIGFKQIPKTDVYLSSSALKIPTELDLFKNRNLL